MTASKRLGGKVAIVTGASRGIGRAIAERLAKEGASVVVHYSSSKDSAEQVAELCRRSGVEARLFQGNLLTQGTASLVCDFALEAFGRVDVLVNNAGMAQEDLLLTLADERIDETLTLNAAALVRLTRECLRPMLRQRSGAIVNVSSVAATLPGRGSSVYAGTKGFVESFTRAMAVEVGRKGIRVNAVAPGAIETDMTSSLMANAADQVRARIPMRRFGKPAEIASVVAFLASEDASYVNGAVIPADGGYLAGG